MLAEERPDCVYIAVTHDAHFDLAMLCLAHDTPVLCEKSMFQNSREAETFFTEAEGRGLFSMEAMWSRFLPPVVKARKWVDEGRIGRPVFADMTIPSPATSATRSGRLARDASPSRRRSSSSRSSPPSGKSSSRLSRRSSG